MAVTLRELLKNHRAYPGDCDPMCEKCGLALPPELPTAHACEPGSWVPCVLCGSAAHHWPHEEVPATCLECEPGRKADPPLARKRAFARDLEEIWASVVRVSE